MQHMAAVLRQIELIGRRIHHARDFIVAHAAVLGEDFRLADGRDDVDVVAGHADINLMNPALGLDLCRTDGGLDGGKQLFPVVPVAVAIARIGHCARSDDLTARKAAALRDQRNDF